MGSISTTSSQSRFTRAVVRRCRKPGAAHHDERGDALPGSWQHSRARLKAGVRGGRATVAAETPKSVKAGSVAAVELEDVLHEGRQQHADGPGHGHAAQGDRRRGRPSAHAASSTTGPCDLLNGAGLWITRRGGCGLAVGWPCKPPEPFRGRPAAGVPGIAAANTRDMTCGPPGTDRRRAHASPTNSSWPPCSQSGSCCRPPGGAWDGAVGTWGWRSRTAAASGTRTRRTT